MKFLLVILALAIIAFVVYKVVKSKSRKPKVQTYSQPHTYSGLAYAERPRNTVTKPTMSPSREAQLGGRIERKPVTRTKPVVEKPRRQYDDSSSDDYVAVSEPADFGYWGSDSGSSSSYSSDSGSSSSSSSDSGSSSSSSDY